MDEVRAAAGADAPEFWGWMSSRAVALCPDHGTIVQREDLDRYLRIRDDTEELRANVHAATADDESQLVRGVADTLPWMLNLSAERQDACARHLVAAALSPRIKPL